MANPVNPLVAIDRWPRWKLVATGSLLFATSRAALRASGAYFDESALDKSWQHLDPVLLRDRLLESLFYLHAQPPAFNAFLGVVLKAAGPASHVVFYLLFMLMGAGLYAITFLAMRAMAVSQASAFVISSLFALSPAYILYEHWLFYTMPLATMVGGLLLSFVALCTRKTTATCASFFALLGLLCATHGLFHLVYFLGCIAFLLAARLLPASKILLAAVVPLLLVTSIYAKNEVLFGQFTTSTWLGMNLALRRVEAVPLDVRTQLATTGALSDVAVITPFSALARYPAHYRNPVPERFAHVPALAAELKSNGEPNLNHIAYVEIAKSYKADTRFVLAHYPKVLLESLARGWYEYFKPASDYWFLEPNLAASPLLRGEATLFDRLGYGVPFKGGPGLFLAAGIPLLVLYALLAAFRPSLLPQLTREQRLVLMFCAGTIAFVAVVGNTLNALENMRLRFMTDPLLAVLLGFWVQHWLAPRVRQLRRGRHPLVASV